MKSKTSRKRSSWWMQVTSGLMFISSWIHAAVHFVSLKLDSVHFICCLVFFEAADSSSVQYQSSFFPFRSWNQRPRFVQIRRRWTNEPQQSGAVSAAGSVWARPGSGSPLLPLPVRRGVGVRKPGPAPPDSEPLHGRPRRAAPSGSGPVAFADAAHLPPPADRKTSRCFRQH